MITESANKETVRPAIWPDTVFVAADAVEDAMTKRVLERLKPNQVFHIPEGVDPVTEAKLIGKELQTDAAKFSLGKRLLLLTRYNGSWLRSCPGTADHVCCNLWIVNPGSGCPMDCAYCYLQSYLARNPTSRLYTNTNDLLGAIEARVNAEPSRLFRIGTGELIDSLVWDDLTDQSLELVPFFARYQNLVLELKTKSTTINNLLSLRNAHNGNTVVSWSVNARSIIENEERNTASLDERIEAAAKVIDAGYRVGLHFDPIIHFEGWEDGYREAIRDIFASVDPTRIAWVSVSTLRYKRDMQDMLGERFPESKLAFGEQFLASDNKLRYFQPIRFKLERFVWNELKAVFPTMPVYMCMESSAAWREVSGGPPVAGSELVEIFSRRGKMPKPTTDVQSLS